jgi:quercetin dioxygenase-like cupin family protein
MILREVINVADEVFDQWETNVLCLAYRQICTSYADISDFRGKLLTLLPLATGTGAFLLLERGDSNLLGPIGVFGAVVTLGLFMYELRGIQRCHRLEDQACTLEEELGLDVKKGPFLGQPKRSLWGMLGPPAAGLAVYLAVVFAWLYIAGVGFDWWTTLGQAPPAWVLIPVFVALQTVGWLAVRHGGWWPRQWQPPWPEGPDEVEVRRFEAADAEGFDSHRFTGRGERRELLSIQYQTDVRIAWISFQDGARTNWHRHSGEQALYVLDGRGCVGTKTKVLAIGPRDIVRIPSGTWHWHGGMSGEPLVHLAVTGGTKTKWPRKPNRPEPYGEGSELVSRD